MKSLKDLKAVAHDIGHHAQSGLSYLYPHLGQLCRAEGRLTVGVELVSDDPYPAHMPRVLPLELALKALSTRLAAILEAYGFPRDLLSSAQLAFAFDPNTQDNSRFAVTSTLSTGDRSFTCHLPPIGS